jgi:hypothetical protein
MAIEPIGEERADLRVGALASVFLNMNIDTKATGGVLQPERYVSGWGPDRVYMLAIKPPGMDQESTKEDQSLNNPIVWDNFTASLAHGREVVRG